MPGTGTSRAAVKPQVAAHDGYYWIPQVCPICKVPPTKFVGRRGGAAHRAALGVECQIWRCGECGLVFPDPMPVPVEGIKQHYELDAEQYFQHHELEGKTLCGSAMLRRAEELTGRKGRMLDIGAGRGELLRAGSEAGWLTVGIEPSASFADQAEQYSGVEIKREPLEECNFPDASFDVVILAAVLEHVDNPDQIIGEIARILRRGGALFLDVPNEQGLYFRVGNLYQRLSGRDWTVNLAPTFEPFHLFGFNATALRKLVTKHGFEVSDWRVYGGRSLLPRRSGLLGYLEQQASELITAFSDLGGLGTYIETWVVKQ
ncbi:MAG: class I SAM-dependent methyltransferase [Acidobacteriota bacterium]|nr:class I SAM-dependent methyltransferase [Acidobacteriota bacterium]